MRGYCYFHTVTATSHQSFPVAAGNRAKKLIRRRKRVALCRHPKNPSAPIISLPIAACCKSNGPTTKLPNGESTCESAKIGEQKWTKSPSEPLRPLAKATKLSECADVTTPHGHILCECHHTSAAPSHRLPWKATNERCTVALWRMSRNKNSAAPDISAARPASLVICAGDTCR